MNKIAGELKVSRFQVPYRVYGQGGDVVLCLSGAKQTMSAWKSFVSKFSSSKRIVLFDMPGQGKGEILSGHPGIDLDEQVDVVDALITEVRQLADIDHLSLVGGSWGSIVAASYAARYPQGVDSLVLGSFGTKPNVVLTGIIDQVKELVQQGRGKEIAPIMIEKFGAYIPEVLKRRIVAQFDNMREDQFQAFYEHACFVSKMGDLRSYVKLQDIVAPTMIVMGQYDTIMDLFDTKKAAKDIANSEYHVIKGVGHFLHLERESILDMYDEFFDKVRAEKRALIA